MQRFLIAVAPLGFFVALATGCSAVNPLEGYVGAPNPGGSTTANEGNDDGGTWSGPAYDASPPPTPVWHHDGGPPTTHDAEAPLSSPDAGGPGVTYEDAGSADAWGSPYDAGQADDGATSPTGADGGSFAAAVAACEDGVNSLRAQNNLSPLIRSASLESYGAQAAASDALSGQEDGYFQGSGGNGVSSAEDEFDGAQIDPGGSALDVFNQGLIDEENGEIDGENDLFNQGFTEIGCGVAKAADGNYWVAIEYQ